MNEVRQLRGEEFRPAACEGKFRHRSFYAAKRTLRRHDRARQLEPFHCPHCGGWHVANKDWRADRRGSFAHRRRELAERDALADDLESEAVRG